MLLSHLLFLSLVCVTINGQVRRTFTCSRNPDAGATTPKAEAHTTNVGATTTKAGTATTKAGATTPKAEAPTTNVRATTIKAGTTTTKAGTTITKAGATTPKADAPTTNVGATTTKAGATIPKAEAPTTNVGATTTKTGTATTKAGAATTKAEETTNKAGATTTKAEETTPKADVPTTNVGTTTTKTGTTTTKAGATTPKADAPTTNIGATTSKAGTTTTKAGTTTTKAGTITTKVGATTPKADAPTTNVGATTTKAGATTTKAGAPTTKAEATTPTADSPTTNIGATTTKAGATTNRAGATTTKAEATTTNCNGACRSSMSIVNGSLTDCTAIYIAGCNESGIYNITPNGWTEGPFEAYCDMDTVTVLNSNKLCIGRGWTVFQRRVNGSVDFNRNWTSYKEGFGQLDHEFWLGNEKLHYLTKEPGTYRLRIDLVSSSGTSDSGISYHACYKKFYIKEEGEKYKLHASSFHGTSSLRGGLSDQNGKEFSTYDRDNTESNENCADMEKGGWWHEKCEDGDTNLNGVYGSNQDSTSIYWKGLPNGESITFSEMKIRHCTHCNYHN